MITFKQENCEDVTYAENDVEMFHQSSELLKDTTITTTTTTNAITSKSITNTEKPKRKTVRKSKKKSDDNVKQDAEDVIKVPTTNYEINAALRSKLLGGVENQTKSTENVVVQQQQQQSITDNNSSAVQSWPVDMSKVLQQCDIDRNIQITNGLQQLINQQQQQQVVVTSTGGGSNGTTVGQQVFVWPIDMSSYIT